MSKAAQQWPVGLLIYAGAVTLTVLIGGFGGWAVYANLSGAVVADGTVMVAQNRQIIQHPDGGVVAAVLVREGDVVARGDILIKLDPSRLGRTIDALQGQTDTLTAQRARLLAERDGLADVQAPARGDASAQLRELLEGQRRLFQARRATRVQELGQQDLRRLQIAGRTEGIKAQLAAFSIQHSLIAAELEQQQNLLARGLAQSARVSALHREMARLEGVLGELKAQISVSQERFTEVSIQTLKLQNQWREQAVTQLRENESQLWDLTQRQSALIEQRDNLDIRAPVSGIVYGLEVFAERSVLRAAQPLMFLVPQDRPMTIVARVRLLDIDQVRPGQPVDLRFPGISDDGPASRAGRVARVSPDAIADPNGAAAYYSAQIELIGPSAGRPDHDLALRPGMPVQAFIKTGQRSPISFLVQPLAEYFRKAFRES